MWSPFCGLFCLPLNQKQVTGMPAVQAGTWRTLHMRHLSSYCFWTLDYYQDWFRDGPLEKFIHRKLKKKFLQRVSREKNSCASDGLKNFSLKMSHPSHHFSYGPSPVQTKSIVILCVKSLFQFNRVSSVNKKPWLLKNFKPQIFVFWQFRWIWYSTGVLRCVHMKELM